MRGQFCLIADDVKLGSDVAIYNFVNLYGCEIGDGTKIGSFVEIQKGARIGRNCKVSSHTFICEGVEIEDEVFIGHGVNFINDKYPRATAEGGALQTEADWTLLRTTVRRGASIGTGATILGNIEIGERAIIGAGAVVTRNVPPGATVAGNPARVLERQDTEPEDSGLRIKSSMPFILSPESSGSEFSNPMIPFVDLKAQYQSIKGEVDAAIQRVLDNTSFILGREVEAFEEAFAGYVGARFCVGVSNGTAAVQLAVMACGIGAGDEVIVPANTFFASAEGVSTAGASPVFVDADPISYAIDVAKIEAAITERTRAIMPVHLYGQSADLDPILELAKRHNLFVIEDAAQAHGALYKERRVGSFGHAASFSFYPGKNLGAYGEGGAVMTNDEEVARRLRLLRDHGSERKYHHDIIGYNFRLEGIQGAVLSVKLKHLDGWNDLRREHAVLYDELLHESGLALPREMDYARHIYHLYVVQAAERDALQKSLTAAGVQTGIHYPIPIHLQPAYAFLGHREGDFPEAERQARSVLSLPMFPELTREQIEQVAQAIHAAGRAQKAGTVI